MNERPVQLHYLWLKGLVMQQKFYFRFLHEWDPPPSSSFIKVQVFIYIQLCVDVYSGESILKYSLLSKRLRIQNCDSGKATPRVIYGAESTIVHYSGEWLSVSFITLSSYAMTQRVFSYVFEFEYGLLVFEKPAFLCDRHSTRRSLKKTPLVMSLQLTYFAQHAFC